MQHDLENTLALLASTPPALNALLRDLPAAWTEQNEGENTFSPLQVIGHLIHGERTDWMPRVRMILEFGDSRTFEPFDRLGHIEEIQGKSLAQLLDAFAELRVQNLDELRSMRLTQEDLEREGLHPVFNEVTLSQLLATWAVHDMTHLHQISRTLAHQYREAVGPWNAFLGVLKCEGHSS
jgi:hypothetical protein